MVLFLFVTSSLFQADPIFSQSPQFARAPGRPVAVTRGSGPILLADINRDGHLDLVTKHLTNRAVSVLLGDGRGHFTSSPQCSMKLDFEPGWIAVTNLNDGKTSLLAVASKERSNELVRVFVAHENGHFDANPRSKFSVPASENGYKPILRFVDLNEDGKTDLISANGRRDAMEIYVGDGHGGFSRGSTVKLESGNKVRSFGVGDLDGDGHLDLATTTTSSPPDQRPARLVVRRGDGKGGFADAGPPFSVPADPTILAVADINSDGRPDILLSHGRSNIVTVLPNDGRGGFSRGSTLPLASGMSAYAIADADLNGDKHGDLIISAVNDRAPYDSKIVVFLGDGHGGFAPAPGSPFSAEPGAYTLAIGDVNEDSKLDIAASSFESSTVTILLGQ